MKRFAQVHDDLGNPHVNSGDIRFPYLAVLAPLRFISLASCIRSIEWSYKGASHNIQPLSSIMTAALCSSIGPSLGLVLTGTIGEAPTPLSLTEIATPR
jgi:hypothetical protein